MKNVETNYRTQFDPNNIVEDGHQIIQVLNEYKKWAEYMYNGKPYYSFSRKNWSNIETVFIDKNRFEQQKEYDTEIAKAWKKIETFKVETQTQTELKVFQRQTRMFNSLPEAQTYVTALDEQTLLNSVEQLLEDYQDLRKNLPTAEWNRYNRNELYDILTDNIRSLKRARAELKRHKYKKGLNTLKARVWQLMYYFPHYEEVRQILALWWATTDIPRIIDSKKDAKNARKREKRDAKEQQELNSILSETAILSQQNMAWERLEEVLENATNWGPMPTNVVQNTDVYTGNSGPRVPYWNVVCRPKSFNRRLGERFSNMLEQIFPERMNRDPRQREAWTNIWSLVAVWGAIFMWIKAISSLKKWADWKRNRWWFAWWTAWTLALLNWDKVINTIQDAFNWHPAEKTRAVADMFSKYWFTDTQAMNMADRYVWAPIATMSALHFIPIYELNRQHILQDNGGKIEFNYNSFENYLNTLDLTDDQKQQLLTQWQKIRDDNLIGLGLWTFWINTMSDLINASNWDQTTTLAQLPQAQEWRNKSVERLSSWVNPELFKHWLRAKTPTALDQIIKEYEDEKDTTGIKKLILRWMKSWLLEMWDNNKSYSLEEMVGKDPDILDLEKMTMIWFKNPKNDVIFETYEELFDAVYVTELIKYNFAWRTAKKPKPFHIDPLTNRLEFDDKNWYEILENETTVLWRKAKKDIPMLWKNLQAYADYLNEWRDTTGVKVDLLSYPLVNGLWIDFYWDSTEVQKLEKFLNEIKTEFWPKYSVYNTGRHTTNGTLPYKVDIWGNLIFIDNMNAETDVSKKLNTKLSKFWTVRYKSENKEKLLDYLNDPANWMFS